MVHARVLPVRYTVFMLAVVLAISFPQWCEADMTANQLFSIDLNQPSAPVVTDRLGLGAVTSPNGITIGADSRCLYRNGQPWIPIMGEFHYSRYPREEWRDELLKMKAGGIDVVATYVFWIHHEEQQGKFDWTGQRSLRDFLKLCGQLDMLAIVRLGPWSHGEVRNGGFPDWVQDAANKKSFKSRTADPEFMKLVEPYYKQIAAQMEGLLWKDGGPVIGVQLENECWDITYLMALKKLARDNGIDVPFYTMTGWNSVPIPKEGLLPLFGAYADGFWTDNKLSFRKWFLFSPIRDDGDMGAINGRLSNIRPERNKQIERFPYVCCEIGGGMPSSYDNRIFVTPEDTASIALVRLGSGNNMPGYYMYHGGVNPQGETTLNETKATGYPNDLPVKDYDFCASIGSCGQVREQYQLLRQQHLFLKDFGGMLAMMPAFFPQVQPANFDDVTTVRWSVRSDGQSGFIFFNNHQRYLPLPAKKNVQFAVKTKQGVLSVPGDPITLPAGSYGIWPFNLDCGGIRVEYATAQLLCMLDADGQRWFFFTAIEGITPEFVIKKSDGEEKIKNIRPGTGIAFTRKSPDGQLVNFIVLTPQQGKQLSKLSIAGRQRVILCGNAILPDPNDRIQVESLGSSPVELALFPRCSIESGNGKPLKEAADGIFQRFHVGQTIQSAENVPCDAKKVSSISGDKPANAMIEDSWKDAAVWKVRIPNDMRNDILLRIHYTGDVARVYAADKLIMDNFYNGQPFDIALWRLTPRQRDAVEIRIMPLRSNSTANMTAEMRPDFSKSASFTEVSKIEAIERTRWTLKLSDNKLKP